MAAVVAERGHAGAMAMGRRIAAAVARIDDGGRAGLDCRSFAWMPYGLRGIRVGARRDRVDGARYATVMTRDRAQAVAGGTRRVPRAAASGCVSVCAGGSRRARAPGRRAGLGRLLIRTSGAHDDRAAASRRFDRRLPRNFGSSGDGTARSLPVLVGIVAAVRIVACCSSPVTDRQGSCSKLLIFILFTPIVMAAFAVCNRQQGESRSGARSTACRRSPRRRPLTTAADDRGEAEDGDGEHDGGVGRGARRRWRSALPGRAPTAVLIDWADGGSTGRSGSARAIVAALIAAGRANRA